jgi:micrococcal nuclease
MARRAILILVVALLAAGAIAAYVALRGSPFPAYLGEPIGGGTGGTSDAGDGAVPDAATDAVVEFVHDGDTLFLDDGRKVRLIGIDTPEVGDNAECFGDEATAALRALVPEGSSVRVLADQDPYDQYGRSLLFVFTADGTNVNLELVREGAAEVVYFAPNDLYQPELLAAETAARDAGLGLWGACA